MVKESFMHRDCRYGAKEIDSRITISWESMASPRDFFDTFCVAKKVLLVHEDKRNEEYECIRIGKSHVQLQTEISHSPAANSAKGIPPEEMIIGYFFKTTRIRRICN